MNDFYIALGANLPSDEGLPIATLKAAIEAMRSSDIDVITVSSWYQTPCFPPGAGPDYVNAAAHIQSTLTPYRLLDRLHEIEAQFGRERKERWGMRTLDLDLIACGTETLPSRETFDTWFNLSPQKQRSAGPTQLILPHPRMQDRAFVLVPMKEIAPNWRHPVLNRTIAEMYDTLPPEDLSEIVMLES